MLVLGISGQCRFKEALSRDAHREGLGTIPGRWLRRCCWHYPKYGHLSSEALDRSPQVDTGY